MAYTTAPVTGSFTYQSGSTKQQIVCCGGKIYIRSGNTTTLLYSGQDDAAYYSAKMWSQYDGTKILLMTNGVDPVVLYNGSTVSEVTFNDPDSAIGTFRPKYIFIWRGRLGYADDDKLYFPRPLDLTDGENGYANFDNTNNTVDVFFVEPGLGGTITGVEPLTQGICVIYKQGLIRALSGVNPFGSTVDPFRIEGITDETGCIAPRSIVKVKNDHWFLSEGNGYRQLSRVIQGSDLEPFQPTGAIKDEVEDFNYANTTAISNSCAAYVQKDNRIYLAVPTSSSSENNRIICFNTLTGGIEPRDDNASIAASVLHVFNRSLYHGDYDGLIHLHGTVNNYNGSAIDSYWESKWLPINSLNQKKRFKHLLIYFQNPGDASIIIQWKILKLRGSVDTHSTTESSGSTTSGWDVGTWDGTLVWDAGGSDLIARINNLGRGSAIKIKVSNAQLNQTFEVQKIELGYQNLGRVAA